MSVGIERDGSHSRKGFFANQRWRYELTESSRQFTFDSHYLACRSFVCRLAKHVQRDRAFRQDHLPFVLTLGRDGASC